MIAYRGNGKSGQRGGVGVATAPHWSGPYTAIYDKPLFSGYAEDPTLYLSPDGLVIHMIAHGELKAGDLFDVGVHAVSGDGVTWSKPVVAYTVSTQNASLPQLDSRGCF